MGHTDLKKQMSDRILRYLISIIRNLNYLHPYLETRNKRPAITSFPLQNPKMFTTILVIARAIIYSQHFLKV